MIRSRGRLYGDFSSWDKIFRIMWEVSSPDENLKILILIKIIFWIDGIFCFNPEMKLKLRLHEEKWCFIPGWKFQPGVRLQRWNFIPDWNIYFFACNHHLFFILKTVARWDEISTRLCNNNFIPGLNLLYNQPLKTLQLSYKFPKVYRYDDILSFFPSSGLKPRINFCSQICTNMK